VYWRLYDSPSHARSCFDEFRHRYNTIRPHWALTAPEGGDRITPSDVYVEGRSIGIPAWQGWARRAKVKLDVMLGQDAA
jgi:transposase InsO family protein